MIKTIIFDFGNVFIDLDIEAAHQNALNTLKVESLSKEIQGFNSFYEQGLISTSEFINFYTENFPELSKAEITNTWNYMLREFPEYRFDFLKKLKESSKYKLILLSNTNDLHISYIKRNVAFYETFKNCFDAFYLSHEINLVKPNPNIFEFVLNENNLKAEECLFVDDNNDNIKTANQLKINTWHINPENEDVINLFKINKNLF